MFGFGILSGLLILPLVGALGILLLRGDDEATRNNARWIALVDDDHHLPAVALWPGSSSTPPIPASSFSRAARVWFSDAIAYRLGVDGISLPFVLLTTFLMPFCIAASWHVDHRRASKNI